METLATFYKSKKWEKLLKVLKMERVNENGELICFHCGKPITKAYDAIGHHLIFLTEENVNDANISLNPELVQFVHMRCHNLIHEKLGYTKREIFLVYGSPLSGKTTWIKENMVEGDLLIDIDSIWECVSGCPRYVKPNRVKSVVFRIRDDLIDMVKCRYGRWNNAYICGGYPLISERERLTKELGAREIFIDTPQEECLMRLEQCSDRDKAEWRNYIEEWWKRYGLRF